MKRDSFIPSAIPVEAALAMYDAADVSLNTEAFMGAARDEVISDLMDGQKVDRFRFIDVLDSALNERYSVELSNLADLLLGDDGKEAFKQRLVTEFVDRNERLVQDRAVYLAESAADDAEAEDE